MSSTSTITIQKKLADFLVRNIFGHEPCHDFNPTAMGDRLLSLNKRLQYLFNITSNIIIPTSTPMTVGGNNNWIDYDESDENAEQDNYKIEKYVNMEQDSTSDILNTTALNFTVFTTDDSSVEVNENTQEELIFNNIIGRDYLNFVRKFALNNSFNCEDMIREKPVNTRSAAKSVRMCINGIQEIVNNIDENRIYLTSYSKYETNNDTNVNKISQFITHQEGGRIGFRERERPNIFDVNTNLITKDDVKSEKYVKLKDEKNITNKTVTEYDQLLNVFQFLIQTFEELNFPESVKFYEFYRYAVIYFIKNINNTLSIYSINNCNFIKDSLFYYFVNKYTNDETNQFLDLDNRQKNGILNEIYRIRLNIAGIDGEKNIFDVYAYTNEEKDEGEDKDEGEIVGGKKKVKMGASLKDKIYTNKDEGILNNYVTDVTVPDGITDQDLFLVNIEEQSFRPCEQFFTDLKDITYNAGEGVDGKYELQKNNFERFEDKVKNPMKREFDKNKNRLLNAWKRRGGRDQLKYNNIVKEVINTVSSVGYNKIFQSIHAFKSIQAVGDIGTPNSLSIESKKYVNYVLQTVCDKVNKLLGDQDAVGDNEITYANNINNGKVFLTERQLIDKVANGGSPSGLDDALYTAFTNFLERNTPITEFLIGTNPRQVGKWSRIDKPADWTKIHNNYKTTVENRIEPVNIINNAMTVEFEGKRIVNQLAEIPGQQFKIQCPITSILDSQGSFGSCTGGTRAPNIVKKNLNISIETKTDGNSITDFVFTMELIHKPNGKTILSYTLQCKEFFIGPEINTHIGDKTLNILSANKSFSDVLLQIENYATTLSSSPELNNIFDNEDIRKSIMTSLSRKFMGDFSQELNSITSGAHEIGSGHQLLCNGDRPSFVRASLLTLLADTGINGKAGGLYISNNGGYLIKKNGKLDRENSVSGGGKKRKTRRKISRKKKGHKKTKKRRTIKKNRKN